MPVPAGGVMEQDFPRGGGTRRADNDLGGVPAAAGKKKRRSQKTIIDSAGSARKDDLIVADEDKDDDEGIGADSDEELLNTVGSDDLFKMVKPKPSKKIRDRARAAAAAAAKEGDAEDEGDFVVEPLTYDAIQVGLLSLGVVHEIRQHEVVVSLPGRTVGAIPLTAVSTPYTNLLTKIESGAAEISALKPLSKIFTVGQVLIVRVTHIYEALTPAGGIRRTIVLSSNPVDLHSSYNATLLQEGMQFTVAVQSVEDHGLIMDVGIRGVRAFLPRNRLPAPAYADAAVGQLFQCRIVQAKVQRLLCNVTLQAVPAAGRASASSYIVEGDSGMNAALLLPGMVLLDGHVMQVHKTGLKVYFLELMGSVHADHTGKAWQLPLDIERYSQVQATVLYIQPSLGALPALTLRRDLCPGRVPSRMTSALQRGVSYQVTVERFEKRGIIVRFENGAKGIVSTRRTFPQDKRKTTQARQGTSLSVASITGAFPPASKHRCRLLEYSELDDVYVGSFAHADAPETIPGAQGPQQQALRAGAVVKCTVVEWKKTGALVRAGVNGNGGSSSMAFIPNLHFDKYDEVKTRKRHHPEGAQLKARVLSNSNGSNEDARASSKVLLTARKKLVQVPQQQAPVPVPEEVGQCTVGMTMRGMVFRAGSKGLHVVIVGGVIGFVPASLVGVPPPYIERQYPRGEIVTVRVTEVEPQRPTLIFCLQEEGEMPDIIEPKEEPEPEPEARNRANNKTKKTKKRKRSQSQNSDPEDAAGNVDVEIKEEPEKEEIEVFRPLKRSIAELRPAGASASFWDADEEVVAPKEETLGDSDADEHEHTPAKKSKKQRAAEREAEIRQRESALADPTRAPASVDDYELLLMASPHSSMAWIKYISMQLEAGNLAAARAVGERALSTIPCTEEQERFNVWTALLNLENEHGTADSLRARFTAALRNCDELATYRQMAQIYTSSKKNDEARSLLRTMTKKFPTHVEIWSQAAQHLYRTRQLDEGRALYARAVAALPARNHVEIISKLAQLELAYGDFEQGRALYEKLVSTYGARVDIWLVYINQLIKQKDFVGARALFERVTSVGGAGVNPRKMQPVFKRWLEFEREHGTLESVAGVEEVCVAYYKTRLGLSVLEDCDGVKLEA